MRNKYSNDIILYAIFTQLQVLDKEELKARLKEAEEALSTYEAIGIVDGNPTYYNKCENSKAQIQLLKDVLQLMESHTKTKEVFEKLQGGDILKKI